VDGTEDCCTLVCEVGRRAGDGLPEGAAGAVLLCCAAGQAIDAGECALIARAKAENAVIVAEITPLFDAGGTGRGAGHDGPGR